MTDDEKIRFTDFLSAAKRTLAGEQTAEEQAREKKRVATTAAKMGCYNQFIRPIADALCALPEKNGKKFSCTVHCDDGSYMHVLRIRMLYHTCNDPRPEFSPTTKKLNIDLYGGEADISFIFLAYNDASKAGNGAVMPVKNSAEVAAALGKWVAQVAPERLAELETALQGSAPRRIRIMNPLNPKKPK